MKKLPQSAGPEVQNSLQRKQRRNYQVGRTKKRSVFLPVPEKKPEAEKSVTVESCAPKGKPHRKLKRGQPNSRSKLTSELSAEICGYVADGMSWQDAAAMVGVHRNVISIWKAKGDSDPQSEYGVFLRAAERAELRREQVHLKFISQDRDWKASRMVFVLQRDKTILAQKIVEGADYICGMDQHKWAGHWTGNALDHEIVHELNNISRPMVKLCGDEKPSKNSYWHSF